MNESEQRRRQLLRETRNLYQEKDPFPAVHPRYRIMSELTSERTERAPKGSLKLRIGISLLCFVCYLFMEYGKVSIRHIDSSTVRAQIKKEFHFTQINDILKEL